MVVVGTPGKLMDHAMEGICELCVTHRCTHMPNQHKCLKLICCVFCVSFMVACSLSFDCFTSIDAFCYCLLHGLHDLRIDVLKSSKPAGRLILNELNAIVIDEVDSLLSMSRKDESRMHHTQLVMMKLDADSSQDHVELLLQHLGVNDQAQQEPQDKEISRIQGKHLKGSLMFTFNGFASEI